MSARGILRLCKLTSSFAPLTNVPKCQMSTHANGNILEVLQQKNLGGRLFTLNRPAVYNALSLGMIRLMLPQLQAWEGSDMCKVIILKSDHPKAFCAGGDVRTIVEKINANDVQGGLQFMNEEYQLNHFIATTPKPFVALIDGITMGGGVGLSVHAPFRVATEKTVFAMPETEIGLFCDVGGSFFLSRLDGELGTYLGMTGQRLKGSELVSARLATHYVPSERLKALTERLCELEASDWSIVNAALEEFAEPATGVSFDEHRHIIDRCFAFNTVSEIMKALEKEQGAFATETLNTLKKMSPLSLSAVLQQVRKGKSMDIASVFKFEWNMLNNIAREQDFVRGVTNKLINKSKSPTNWPSANADESSFAKLAEPNNQVQPLALLRESTYMEYPHRFLALPSEADIRRVIRGEEPSVGDFAFESAEQVESWFADYWPPRSLVQEGIHDFNALCGNSTNGAIAPIQDFEMSVGHGKIGVKEHVRRIVARCCTITKETGVQWKTLL